VRFKVPQFIETEEKVVGPFTLKQFVWVGGGGALIFVVFQFGLGLFWSFFAIIPIMTASLAMAFYRVDGMPLPTYIMQALGFLLGTKRYYFKKEGTYEVFEGDIEEKDNLPNIVEMRKKTMQQFRKRT